MVLTDFQRQQLVQEGFPAERIEVIPNMVDAADTVPASALGSYVGYVGRISPEKDLPTLMKAARTWADIPFKAAGSYEGAADVVRQRPSNFDFLGHLRQDQLAAFYADSRIVVLCSVWYEGFPTTILEAMVMGKPVVCSRIGGLPEIVEDGVNRTVVPARRCAAIWPPRSGICGIVRTPVGRWGKRGGRKSCASTRCRDTTID